MAEPEEIGVIIVGGGFAGLSAAYKLKVAADQLAAEGASAPVITALDCIVLEASRQLGGRTETRNCDRDYGAGYVGQSQNYIQHLIRVLQIETEPTWLERTQQWLYHEPAGNKVVRYPGDDPLAFPGVPNALYRLSELDMLVLELRRKLHEPWTMLNAREYDKRTVADWILRQRELHDTEVAKGNPAAYQVGMTEDTKTIFTASVRAAFSLEPENISFLFLLYYAAAAGSYSALVDIAGGDGTAEGTRFKHGTRDAITRLEAFIEGVELDHQPVAARKVRKGQRVHRIEPGPPGTVLVSTKSIAEDGTVGEGPTYVARKVIVALSPPVAMATIDYGALLDNPAGRDREKLGQLMTESMGATIKGFVQFKSAIWRSRGLMGYMLSMADFRQYPVGWTLDNCWTPKSSAPPFLEPTFSLMTFIGGDAAKYWYSRPFEERALAVIEHLRKVYGFTDHDLLDSSNLVANYSERNWPAEQPAVPAPAAMMPKGVLSNPELFRALRQPIGPIHWAGSEAALEWCGYLNGAVESGFRAAGELIDELVATPNTSLAGGGAAVSSSSFAE